jgi:hypothetical protein
MKWNFKTCYITILVYLALAVLSHMSRLSYLSYVIVNYTIITWLAIAVHVIVDYAFIYTLRVFKESRWRILPFYFVIAESLIVILLSPLVRGHLNDMQAATAYYRLIALFAGTVNIYVFINTLMVKNAAIKGYFKTYGFCLLATFAMIILSTFLMPRMLDMQAYYLFSRYAVPALTFVPLMPMLVLYIKLYDQTARFKQNDRVITQKELENVPVGSSGIITAKHTGSGYYEAEFFDDKDNLLNVLTVSSKDIEHVTEADLQTRIEAFGR